ncbi:MAG: GSU2403 family nucleotidyltransferase fold protein [Azonexus sp.]|nr:GSU2403 family nucleotidyltransferase fold protein [Azonexus sp.]
MELQSAVSQTLYAQLLEEAMIYNAIIFEQGVTGSPYLNRANDRAYWYWQVSEPGGKLRRMSLGRDTPETQALVAQLVARKKEATDAITTLRSTTRAFVASGGMATETAHFKVMEHLARAGLFRKGLVLVGSHAFTALGNMLGLRWGNSLKTSDMDFARAHGVALALPASDERLDLPSIVKAQDPSFFAVPQLDNRQPSTAMLSRKTRVKIDFLTTLKAGDGEPPRYFEDIGIAATPLRYMDYLLGGDNRRGLVIGTYAFPINLPDPARFAIHKLVIAQERRLDVETKVIKDIRQASAMIEGLRENGHEHDIRQALLDLQTGGFRKAFANLRLSAQRMGDIGHWLTEQLPND